jgi:hypothetical protein
MKFLHFHGAQRRLGQRKVRLREVKRHKKAAQ